MLTFIIRQIQLSAKGKIISRRDSTAHSHASDIWHCLFAFLLKNYVGFSLEYQIKASKLSLLDKFFGISALPFHQICASPHSLIHHSLGTCRARKREMFIHLQINLLKAIRTFVLGMDLLNWSLGTRYIYWKFLNIGYK